MAGAVTPAVAARSTAGADGRRAAPPRRVRLRLVAAGGALVLLCVLGFAFVASQLGHRVAVLQVSRAVSAGQPITGRDVHSVQGPDDPSLHLVLAAQADQVLGRTAAVPLMAGTLLTDGVVGDAVWPPTGQMTGAVALKAGRAPEGLAPGQRVTVFVRTATSDASGSDGAASDPSPGGDGSGNQSSAATPATFGAVVVSVQTSADGTGTTVLTLLLAADDAPVLAAAPDDGVVVMRGGR